MFRLHVRSSRHSVVIEVAGNNLLQPDPLSGNWLVHTLSQFLLNHFELRSHAIATGLPLEKELAATRLTSDEAEPEEIEGLRFSSPR